MNMLTSKQEAFAISVASGKTQADAYRDAYNVKPTTSPASVQNKASLLMKKGEVRVRVEELKKPIIEASGITLESHLNRLAHLGQKAEEAESYTAAISAEVARGKVAQLYTERVELTGNFNVDIKVHGK
jgi:phage terminase small subunit